MAALAAILPVVSRSSCLALELYQLAASSPEEAQDLLKIAKAINSFASILKQVGTIIKEDDRLPSYEALDVLEDVTVQSQTVLKEIEITTELRRHEHTEERDEAQNSKNVSRNGSANVTRLAYSAAHLESLRLTLAVLLQTLYAAQSIMWSKLGPTVPPKQAAKAVLNERIQLQALIIEQQMSILAAVVLYEQMPRQDARFLMESDSSQSLVTSGRENELPSPSHLHSYLDTYLGSLDTSGSTEAGWLPTVCSVATSRTEHLLEKWTTLPGFDERLRDAERKARSKKHEDQQATVESDSDEETRQRYKPNGAGPASPLIQRSGSIQPLFTDTATLPIPMPRSRHGSTPATPAASPRNSRTISELPASPRSSIGNLPVEAAAAVEAKEEDKDLELEIPWSLRTREYEWRYIDNTLIGSNTDHPPSTAYTRPDQSWIEVAASWVCNEAIAQAGYKATPIQKDRKDGRRTRSDTFFCITPALHFDAVKRLVERTVAIYRQNAPPPRARRSSFERPPKPDRDRTPTASRPHLPPERTQSTTSYPPHPPLDRSVSLPGPAPPPYPPSVASLPPSRPMPMQMPIPMPIPMPGAPPASATYAPQQQYPAPLPNAPYAYPAPPHLQPFPLGPHSPQRQGFVAPRPWEPMARGDAGRYDARYDARYDSRYDARYDSDSEGSGSGGRRRRDRERERGRRGYEKDGRGYERKEKKERKHGKSAAVGTLMGIGGLTALLDGLGGL
ncbi:hypothetical protein C7974DRAFT_77775 [Boeremia exigua]|uniref:uncharacterized protein n=1 Tax=Boeremia exigua TaxID=749465 RepID=UPI001E8EB7D1|nr:uncharacterized protein C7974DRAFT_77775 [Boeremia exigua]KAH6612432.1 hypothetical protein C7974DRAFT_77775 [Boeremia exigua]